MEFPIEIQMLIKDYLRPITRTDWRKGSSITRQYKQDDRSIVDLPIYEDFKEYISLCRISPRYLHHNDQERKKYKMWGKYYGL